MTFGEKLHHLRTERNMSQEALARKLGVSRQAISRWELGEVIPDTANVLAVSRAFGVSTDYLLREESSGEAAAEKTVPPDDTKERQYAVGEGMAYRFAVLAGPAVWHLHADEADKFLLAFALGWTLLFGILLSRTMTRVRKRDWDAAGKLLKNDVWSVFCICFLPRLLQGIPGNWELLLSQLAMVPFLQKNWILLRCVYDLPVKPPKKKR